MLNDIVTVVTNLFRMYIIWRFAGIFLDVESAGGKKQIAGYAVFYFVNSTLFILFHSPLTNLTVNLIGTFLLYAVLYQGTIAQCLLAVGTMYGTGMAADILVVRFMNPHYIPGEPISPLASIATTFTALVLELICEYSIGAGRKFRVKDALRLLGIPVISIGMIGYMIKGYIEYTMLVIVISGGIMLINIVVLYYYKQIQTQYEKEYKQQLVQRQVLEYEQQLNQMKQSYQEIRRVKHEIKHFAFALEEELKKDHMTEVEKMLSEMKTVISEYEAVSWSGNTVLDSILNYMQGKAKQAGAVIDMNIKVPDSLPLNALDMNIILGNLLENAIEAVEPVDNKTIKLQIKYEKGILIICVQNDFDGIVKIKNGKYLTKKADKENHGIGLMNVKRVVDKDKGIIEINASEKNFDVRLMLMCGGQK